MDASRTVTGFLIAGLVWGPAGLADGRDASLERGIHQVERGEWQPAIASLTEAVRHLSGDKKRSAELADAYLYSALAYVGLGETSPAISQFSLALRTDPKIRIPEARQTTAAQDAFDVAQREAVAPPAPKTGGRSALPFVLAGAAAVGGGIAIAAGGGGDAQKDANTIPANFSVTGSEGGSQLLLLNAMPGSSATINLNQSAPILTFVLRYDPSLPGRVTVNAEMIGPSGNCITGRTSEITAIDPKVAAYTLVVNSWGIKCRGAFTTTSMNAILLDADAQIPVSRTSYSGGYYFQN